MPCPIRFAALLAASHLMADAKAATASLACAEPGACLGASAGACGAPEPPGSCSSPGGKHGRSFLQTFGRAGQQEAKSVAGLGLAKVAWGQAHKRIAAARHFLTTSVLRQDLSSLEDSYYNCYDPDLNRTENAHKCFNEFCRVSGLDKEINETEKAIYASNFVDAMVDGVALPMEDVSEQSAHWRACMRKRVQEVKPVCSAKLVDAVNGANLTWTAKTSNACEQMMLSTTKAMQGTLVSDEDWEDIHSGAADKKFGLVQNVKIDGEFDSRQNWPMCSETIGHVRDQGQCGDCWAMAAAGVVEDRLCIASNGSFSGPAAYISGGFIASCGNDAKDGCTGGFVRKALIWAAEHGVPTGGPGHGSDTCVPYFASGDSLNHFFAASHHSPPCPSMCTNKVYPRSLDADRFHPEGFRDTVATSSFNQAVTAIRDNGPIAFAFKVYSDFMSYKSGVYKPGANAEYLGFHAANAIGFGPDYILGVNSWDKTWGDQGLFRIHKSGVSTYWIPGSIVGKGPGYPFPIPGSGMPAPESECFHKGQIYMPLDMKGTKLTHEKDAETCQARCANTSGCAFFSFWNDGTHDGDCHLAAAEASPLQEAAWANVTAGPVNCGDAKDADDALEAELENAAAEAEKEAEEAECWRPDDKCLEQFVYKNNTYAGCTVVDDSRGWCSHVVIFTPNSNQWSYCTWNCPKSTSTTTTAAAPTEATTVLPASVAVPTGSPTQGNGSFSEEDIVRTVEAAAEAAAEEAEAVLEDMDAGDLRVDRCWAPADPCVDEFEYDGANYTGCTTVDNNGMPWCAHTASFESQAWSNCACTCWEKAPDCVGTFRYKNQSYSGCTTVNAGPTAWCALDNVFKPGRWRSCTSLCSVAAAVEAGAYAAEAAAAAAAALSGANGSAANDTGKLASSSVGPSDEGGPAVFGGPSDSDDGLAPNSTGNGSRPGKNAPAGPAAAAVGKKLAANQTVNDTRNGSANATAAGGTANATANGTANETVNGTASGMVNETANASTVSTEDVVVQGNTENVEHYLEDSGKNGNATGEGDEPQDGSSPFSKNDQLKNASACWKRNAKCVAGFTFQGKVYQGCAFKSNMDQAWCPHEYDVKLGGAWSPCTCECWVPDIRCVPEFEYNSMLFTGCVPDIQKTNSAWCSLHASFHVGDTVECTSECDLD